MKKTLIFFLSFFIIITLLKSQDCIEECTNLLQNPNLVLSYTGSETIYLNRAYEFPDNNYVDPWAASAGTPHQSYYNQQLGECTNGWWIPADAEPTFHGQVAHYDPSNQEGYMEGIMQDFDFIYNDFTTYCILFDASITDCNGSNNLSYPSLLIRAGNDIELNSSGNSVGLPFAPQGNDVEVIETVLIDNTSLETFSIEYPPSNQYSQLEFLLIIEENQIDPSETEEIKSQITLENLSLKCNTTAIGAIDFSSSDRMFHFEALNNSTTPIFSYAWDFGDDHMSSDIDPIHVYEDYGPYTVCLDYVDINGCCGSKCLPFLITPPPFSCSDIEDNTIYIDANNPMTKRFSQLVDAGIYTSGGTISLMKIVVDGQFTLDENFNFTFCEFHFQPGAELIVQSPGRIEIRNSTFQGCEKMWKGITVQGGNSQNVFWFRGNTIRDAYAALEITNRSNTLQYSNNFIDNYIGVYSAPSENLKQHFGSPILNSKFLTEGNMLDQYDDQPAWSEVPYAGIFINDLDHLIVRELSFPFIGLSLKNHFIGITNGMVAKYCSNIIVDGNIFRDLKENTTDNISGTCVYGSHLQSINAEENNCDDGDIGFYISRSPNSIINISNNNISKFSTNKYFERAVYLRLNTNSKIEVLNNEIYLDPSSSFGILISTSSNLSTLNVKENNIYHKFEASESISISNLTFQSGVYGHVVGNIIERNIASACTPTIEVSHSEFINFENNIVNYAVDLPGNNTGGCAVFVISYSPHCHFRDNQILFSDIARIGISQIGSLNNLYCCNIIQNGGKGFSFRGVNEMLNLNANEMKNCLRGLHLRNQITPQDNKGNLWTGAFSNATISPPFGSTAQDVALASVFLVNSLQSGNSAMRPTYTSPLEIEEDWFEENGLPNASCGNSPSCGVSPYEFGGGDNDPTLDEECEEFRAYIEALVGPKVLSHFQHQNEWVLFYYVFKHFDNIPEELWKDCSYIKAFMEDNQHIASYVDVDTKINNAFMPSTSQSSAIHKNRELISSAIQSIQTIYDNAPEEFETFDPDVTAYQEAIYNSSSLIQDINNMIQIDGKNNLQNILSDINALNATHEFEEKLKTIWMYKVQIMLHGIQHLNQTAWNEIEEIANGCPDADGLALYEARNLLMHRKNHSYSYIDDEQCTDSDKRNNKNVKKEFNIYPNPTANNLIIENNLNAEGVLKIELFSVDGILKMRKNVLGFDGQVDLDLSSLRSGIYILELSIDNLHQESRKIVITK